MHLADAVIQSDLRDTIQYETKRNFSKSLHSKQNKHFLATPTALNTNERSKYTYELFLTSADRLLLSKSISSHCLLLALEHTFLSISKTTNHLPAGKLVPLPIPHRPWFHVRRATTQNLCRCPPAFHPHLSSWR